MNNKKTFLIIILTLVLVLAGASVLYTHLTESFQAEQLAANTGYQTETEQSTESANTSTSETGASETNPSETAASETNPSETGTSAENSSDTAGREEEQKQTAPDFTVYHADGTEVMLSEYIGKPVIVNFWASWCGPCQMEMPAFQEKFDELGEEIHFLMINMTDGSRETVETASSFIEEKGYTFPVFYDTEADAASAYGAYSLPVTFFIDADGYAIAQATGAINTATLQRGIDMIQ